MELITPAKDRAVELKKQLKEQPLLFPHLADCYMVMGKTKLAAKILFKGLEQYPDTPMGWLVKGNLHVQLNQPKQAMTAFKQVLKLDNDLAYAHEKCADLAREEDNSEWYIYHLQEIHRLEPLDDTVRYKMDIEVLKRIAVEKGLFSQKVINDVRPEILRNKIIDRNLMPKDLKRRERRPDIEGKIPEEETDSFDPFADIMKTAEPEVETPDETDENTEIEDEIELGAWADQVDKSEETASDNILDELLTQTDSEKPVEASSEAEAIQDDDTTNQEDMVEEEIEIEDDNTETEENDTFNEDDEDTHKSPLMKMLAGEMVEQPTSKEVYFHKEEEEAESEDDHNLASKVLRAKDGGNISVNLKTTPEEDEESLERHADAQERIAEIAMSVMDATAIPVKAAVSDTDEDSGDDVVVDRDEENIESNDDISEINDLVEDVIPHSEDVPDEKPVERVATKTLAELYLSQGDLQSSIEVYQDLIIMNPDNESYFERLQALKIRLEEEEENKKVNNAEEN
ncbi:MAG: hypothetical protein HQ568_06690 [Calditrichaeota bacterium]|nr:hypothetical protein [Calditrichota bacterium]